MSGPDLDWTRIWLNLLHLGYEVALLLSLITFATLRYVRLFKERSEEDTPTEIED